MYETGILETGPRVAKTYTRIHRLFKLVQLLQSRRGLKVPELARHCGVCARTMFRDLQTLSASGIECRLDEDTGGYVVPPNFFMPPLELTFEESLALLVLADGIGRNGQILFLAPAARALEKIRGQLPAQISDDIRQIDPHIEVQLARGSVDQSTRDVYERVRNAIATRRMLRCRYDSAPSSDGHAPYTRPFHFRPYKLWYGQRAWYVVGLHGGRKEIRKLKLSRFSALELTDKPFAIPDDFSMDQILKLAWRMIPEGGRFEVAIRFDPQFAETAADTRWHSTQRKEFHEDGSATLRFTVDGLEEIVWWVMGYGPWLSIRFRAH